MKFPAVIIFAALFLCVSSSALAQTFSQVSSGSEFYCGVMPNGSYLLFTNDSGKIVVKDGTDTVVGALVTTPAKVGAKIWQYRWYCVALPGYTALAPRLFGVNPCANGGQAVANCSALVPEGFLGFIQPFTTFVSEPSSDSLNLKINEATQRVNSAPVTGRVRGLNGAPGSAETDSDRCS